VNTTSGERRPVVVDPQLVRATREHYERFPFLEAGEQRIARWSQKLTHVVPEIQPGDLVLDVGCGSGEVTKACLRVGADVVAADLTWRAAHLAGERGAHGIQGSALQLPFRSEAVDHSIAIGVLHHTPNAESAFVEMARVTSRTVTVLLYSALTPYHAAYTSFAPIRQRSTVDAVDRIPQWALAAARRPLSATLRFPMDDEQVRRVIADQLWTPTATFHSPRQVRRWANAAGFEVVRARRSVLYSFTMTVRRRRRRASFPRRRTTVVSPPA
jgi:ubiquinone/menaquinone biosynthesis C-methylase UbiE